MSSEFCDVQCATPPKQMRIIESAQEEGETSPSSLSLPKHYRNDGIAEKNLALATSRKDEVIQDPQPPITNIDAAMLELSSCIRLHRTEELIEDSNTSRVGETTESISFDIFSPSHHPKHSSSTNDLYSEVINQPLLTKPGPNTEFSTLTTPDLATPPYRHKFAPHSLSGVNISPSARLSSRPLSSIGIIEEEEYDTREDTESVESTSLSHKLEFRSEQRYKSQQSNPTPRFNALGRTTFFKGTKKPMLSSHTRLFFCCLRTSALHSVLLFFIMCLYLIIVGSIVMNFEKEDFNKRIQQRLELKALFREYVIVLGDSGEDCGKATWSESDQLNSTVDQIESMVLDYTGIPDSNPFDNLGTSVGFIFITITTIGWGNIHPISVIGQVAHCIMAPFGIIIVLSLLKKIWLFMNYLVKAMFDCTRKNLEVKPIILLKELENISVDTHLVESQLELILAKEYMKRKSTSLKSLRDLGIEIVEDASSTQKSYEDLGSPEIRSKNCISIPFTDEVIYEIGSWYVDEEFIRCKLKTLRNSTKIRSISIINASIIFAVTLFLLISLTWMLLLENDSNVSFPYDTLGFPYSVSAFYFVFTTFSTIGYGEYSVDVDEKCIYHLFFIIVGMSSWAFLCGVMVFSFEHTIDKGIGFLVTQTVPESRKSLFQSKLKKINKDTKSMINVRKKRKRKKKGSTRKSTCRSPSDPVSSSENEKREVTMLKKGVLVEIRSAACSGCEACSQRRICEKVLERQIKLEKEMSDERVILSNSLKNGKTLNVGKAELNELTEMLQNQWNEQRDKKGMNYTEGFEKSICYRQNSNSSVTAAVRQVPRVQITTNSPLTYTLSLPLHEKNPNVTSSKYFSAAQQELDSDKGGAHSFRCPYMLRSQTQYGGIKDLKSASFPNKQQFTKSWRSEDRVNSQNYNPFIPKITDIVSA